MKRAREEDAAREIELLVRPGDRRGTVLSGHGIDLPLTEDRRQIFAMHLDKRKRGPGDFDLDAPAAASDRFSGAEIEQAIVAGLCTAWSEERELDSEILLSEIGTAVPVSRTMAERVREARERARARAVPAA